MVSGISIQLEPLGANGLPDSPLGALRYSTLLFCSASNVSVTFVDAALLLPCSWILYEKPDFQGRCIALEEGITELTNEWAEPEVETEPPNLPPVVIGSVRLAVRVSPLVQPLISISRHVA